MKRWLRKPAVIYLLSHLIALYIRLVFYTSRIERHFVPEAQPYMQGEKQAIMAFWHGRLLMMPLMNPSSRRMDALISMHRDGLLISETMVRFGIGTVAGSSSKGGAAALRGLLRTLREGRNVTITPDGPRGPARTAAQGVSAVAGMGDVAVVPLSFSATRHRRMRSWDRFFVPLPFSRLVFTAGLPIHSTAVQNGEELRVAIEQSLNAITDVADRLTGVRLEDTFESR